MLTKMISTTFWTITLFLLDTNKTLLSHTLAFGQMTWTTFWTKRRTLSKRSSYEKRCFKLEDHPQQATLPRVDHSRKKEKNDWIREKEKLIVMSCTWKIRFDSKWKSKKPKKCWKEKLHKHKSLFSCKESLFSSGDYVWDEKWPFFIIPSLI